MFLSDWSYISIAVVLNFVTLVTYFAANNPPQSPFRFMMIYPDTVVMNIMACRVFRNVKLGRRSQTLITPTQINTGNLLIPHDYIPGTGGESSYHMGGTVSRPMSAEVSQCKELARLPMPDSHRRGIEKSDTHGVEVTKVIELSPS
jgi:hypothetical protein